MLPQNAQQLRPQQHQPPGMSFMPPGSPQNAGFDTSNYFSGNMDPSVAKQMAALNAAGMARVANGRSNMSMQGISSGSFGVQTNLSTSGHDNAAAGHGNQSFLQQPGQSFGDANMSQPNPATRAPQQSTLSLRQRQRNFLTGLANVMNSRGTPLPQALTGFPSSYDPVNSPWKIIEPTAGEVGSFRLAGKDVDMFKLWGTVFQAGGGQKLSQQNSWNLILPYFDLPEQFPIPQPNGQTSVAATLAQYYMAMLHPFEDAYKRNVQEQHKRAMAARQAGVPQQLSQPGGLAQGRSSQQGPQPGFPGSMGQMQGSNAANMMGLMGQSMGGTQAPPSSANGPPQLAQPSQSTPQTPFQRPQSSINTQQQPHPGQGTPQALSSTSSQEILPGSMGPHIGEKNVLDQEVLPMKRRLESEEVDSKRVRHKTDPPERSSSTLPPSSDRDSQPPSAAPNLTTASTSQASNTMPLPPRPRPQPSRRRIEYVPLAREVDTFGGRDLHAIEENLNRLSRRPLRDVNDWGSVDIEALTMSLRSRLSTELSYALTTFTLLSTMRGQTPGSGFPVFQCVDLLDELLDLLEDEAFGDEDSYKADILDDGHITTHREMVNMVYDQGSQLFACLDPRQGSKDRDRGPRQRPGNIVLAITNIIRNLSTIPDNLSYMAQQERLLDLLLRVCSIECSEHGIPRPASSILSLVDLVIVRKDVLYTLTSLTGMIVFTSDPPSPTTLRMARRAFELISSFLVDPAESISPFACAQQSGVPLTGNLKPPFFADIALEVFTRLSQIDSNRQVFAKAVPQAWLMGLVKSLVHRLPVVEQDFQLVTKELWLCYLEKTIMAIYSVAFLAPPELKRNLKADRSLGFTKVMLRMIQKFLMNPIAEGRSWFVVCARRAIETMKVVDVAEDSFDTSKSAVPTMSFGMGYGEVGENGPEKGTGLLGGYRSLAWDMLMVREVDEVMFSELESLARVE